MSSKKYALTGGNGFLGWHVRLALHSYGRGSINIRLGEHFDKLSAAEILEDADVLIHLAGVNRGTDEEVARGNRLQACQAAEALRSCTNPPSEVVYSNSVQSLVGGVYGEAKEEVGRILSAACEELGIRFRSVLLPNVFGEHGRPFYNSVVATFCHLLATRDGAPVVDCDRELTLLHAQDAAEWLVGVIDGDEAVRRFQPSLVSELLVLLEEFEQAYSRGDIPDIATKFRTDLFNTYRSHVAVQGPGSMLLPLERHSDERGAFSELIRSRGGPGQSSFSTTAPGVTRGDHYHRRKIERFVVLSGSATIRLRRMFSDETLELEVDGESPVAIDIPTGWTHNLTNNGARALYTHFWSNDLFDPANPDTVSQKV